MKVIDTPVTSKDIEALQAGDRIGIKGTIYCGRDAVLPKLVALGDRVYSELGVDLEGAVIFHTAVSPAGIGPTSSNKLDIESSMPALTDMGVRIHLGKGEISAETIREISARGAVFAVLPPVTALLRESTLSQEVAAFGELGMEALYRLEVSGIEAIVAAAHGRSIFDKEER